MRQIQIGQLMPASPIAMGCMRIASRGVDEVERWIQTALEQGVNLFDHADIYGGGKSELVFGEALKRSPGLREKIILQSKCGIGSGLYDLSKEHILASVEGSLKRLGQEQLDILLFHRPDVLAEPEEMAEAIAALKAQGKAKYFGVSNMNPGQIKMLEKMTGERFVINQLQFGLMHAGLVTSGLNVNVDQEEGVVRDGGALEFCRERGIVLQAWSPFQYGMFKGCFIGNEKFPEINQKLEEVARSYQASPSAIAVAWILRVPAAMQAVIGTTNPDRIVDIAQALRISLSRQEWYGLYRACGYLLP